MAKKSNWRIRMEKSMVKVKHTRINTEYCPICSKPFGILGNHRCSKKSLEDIDQSSEPSNIPPVEQRDWANRLEDGFQLLEDE